MADKTEKEQVNPFFADFSTRLRDIEERGRLMRERILLLGKNLISTRQEVEDEVEEIKKENIHIKSELEKIKRVVNNLNSEYDKFVKRDEMAMTERMLKDFQPLEFMRRKDVEDLIREKMKKSGK